MGSAIKRVANYAISDTAYGTSWNGVTDVAPSKNAVYDGLAPKANPFFTGLLTETSVAAEESAPLGDELLSASGWTSTDWTGDFASGFDHNTGNTTALTNTLAATLNYVYQITYTVTGRTAGSFTITFGGVTSDAISATGAWGPKAISTGTLSIAPTSTFDGTVVISIKRNTGSYDPVYKIVNSAGGSSFEIRSATNALGNTFIGVSAGSRNTTGPYNLGIGMNALLNVTTGSYNVGIGPNALPTNTTGYNNMSLGAFALQANITGYGNVAIGRTALSTNTTGYLLTAIGFNAGRYTSTGASNEASNNSIYIGNARPYASGDTNEIVIGSDAIGLGSNTCVLGNTSIITTQLRGNVLIGGATVETGSTVTLNIPNGTAPDNHVDNQIIIYSTDSSDSAATLGLFLEQAVEDIGTFTATKKIKIKLNGVEYWLQLDPVA